MPSYELFSTRSGNNPAQRGVAVSGTNAYYSSKMCPSRWGLLSFTLEWTGTPTGTFTLWYSDKDHPDETSDADWKQDGTWSPTNPAGAAGSESYEVSSISKRWARVKYTNASGTGSVTGEQG